MTDFAELPYLDLAGPDFSASSEEVARAREASALARTNYGLAVLRHQQVNQLLKDKRVRKGSFAWPEQNGIHEGLLVDWWRRVMMSQEGAPHMRLRRLTTPAFSSSLVDVLTTDFQRLAEELVSDFLPEGRCEFVSAFAEPYSAKVLCRYIGMDESEWRQIARWSADIGLAFGTTIASELDRIEASLTNLYAVSDDLIERRRAEPGNDVISKLVAAHDAGDSLDLDELRAMISVIIFGGADTTRNQIALSMELFARSPGQWRLLQQDPSLAGNAVEEVMRFRPTVVWSTRMAAEPLDVDGVTIPEGTTLHLLSYPASTDPLVFGDTVFDITQTRKPHFGFGGGPHHCPGHFLARRDMREALAVLAAHLDDPRLASPPVPLPGNHIAGAERLDLTFAPRTAATA